MILNQIQRFIDDRTNLEKAFFLFSIGALSNTVVPCISPAFFSSSVAFITGSDGLYYLSLNAYTSPLSNRIQTLLNTELASQANKVALIACLLLAPFFTIPSIILGAFCGFYLGFCHIQNENARMFRERDARDSGSPSLYSTPSN